MGQFYGRHHCATRRRMQCDKKLIRPWSRTRFHLGVYAVHRASRAEMDGGDVVGVCLLPAIDMIEQWSTRSARASRSPLICTHRAGGTDRLAPGRWRRCDRRRIFRHRVRCGRRWNV